MPATDLPLLLDAVRAASPIAEHYFNADPAIWEKSGGAGPVTEADLAIDKQLNTDLRAARPDYGWLSEETDDDPVRQNHDRVFIVDPIDGTRAFIAGQSNFAIAAAVAEQGRITAAVVHMPIKGVTYAAAEGQGATKNGEPMSISNREALSGAKVLASAPVFKPGNWVRMPKIERHFRTSLAYRMCLVAEGRFDAAVAMRRTWEWDMSAGDLIAREAGAICTDSNGKIAEYNSVLGAQDGMVVANPKLHAELISHRLGD
ncbi:MAG: 3'(2'),5'-bisphosphate nucleotidase CysQ [Pseudomonadota bacterium]